MDVKIIKTEQDYHEALQRLEIIFDSKRNTPQGDELEVLGVLIDRYEKEHFPVEMPDPNEAIKFRMEQLGYNQRDLEAKREPIVIEREEGNLVVIPKVDFDNLRLSFRQKKNEREEYVQL